MTISEWKGYASATPYWTNLSNISGRPDGCNSTGFVRLWRAGVVEDLDAWISSPELALEAGKTYSITFHYITWGDKETVCQLLEGRLIPEQVTSAAISEKHSAVTPFWSVENLTGTSTTTWYSVKCTVTAAEGDKHVAFRVSGKYYKCIGITDFHIAEAEAPSAPGAPEAATGVAAAADADGAISATVTWELPTSDIKGNLLTAIDQVNVLRDEKIAATLDGTATSWTDTEAVGLTAGDHTYAVRVTANGLESKLSETATVKVGPWDYAPADFSDWKSFTTSGNSWVTNSNQPTGSKQSGSMRIWANSVLNNIDSWLTTPHLDMMAGKTYKLKFKYLVWYDPDAVIGHFRGHLATETPDADNSTTIAASPAFLELDNLTRGNSSSDWKEVSLIVTPAEGQQYVTFHVYGQYCKCILISDFSIETYVEKPFHPAAPTGLKATPGANHVLTVALEWTNPERDTEGDLFIPDKTIDNILVYRDGTLAATLPGDATSWTDTEADGLTVGNHTYAVSAVVAGVESALSEEADVTNVGPLQPLDPASWSSAFDSDMTEFENLWSTYTEGTGNKWIFHTQGSIRLMNSMGYNEDAWLMTPPFIFKPGQYYTLTIEGNVDYPKVWDDDEYDYITVPKVPHPLTLALTDNTASPTISQYIINQKDNDADHTTVFSEERSEHTFEFYYDPLNLFTPLSMRTSYDTDIPHHIAIHAGNKNVKANTFIYSVRLAEIPGKTTGVENVAAGAPVPVAVEIYDLTGRPVGNASSAGLDGFPRGIYVIRTINADGSATTRKVIR